MVHVLVGSLWLAPGVAGGILATDYRRTATRAAEFLERSAFVVTPWGRSASAVKLYGMGLAGGSATVLGGAWSFAPLAFVGFVVFGLAFLASAWIGFVDRKNRGKLFTGQELRLFEMFAWFVVLGVMAGGILALAATYRL